MSKKFPLLLIFAGIVIGCQERNTTQQSEESGVAGIVHEEYSGEAPTQPEATEIYEPVPPKITLEGPNGVPSDALVLFDGTNLDQWIMWNDSTPAKWHLNKNGSMTVKDGTGDIRTKRDFGSIQLHLEWKSPAEVRRDGQNRANSGVYLQGLYEIQILDNNENPTYVNGQVGAIYKQHVPLAFASAPTGEWNSYDIIFHAPEFNSAGNKIKSGNITLFHNGILIQDHAEIKGTTEYIGWPKNEAHGKGPIRLQDHNDDSRVSFRNIWVREL